MVYDVFVLIAQDPSDDSKVALTFDSENEARTRYNRLARLGNVELLRIIRNPNSRAEGCIYIARNFNVEAL